MNNKINALIVLVLFIIGLLISVLTFSAFNANKSNKPVTVESKIQKSTTNDIDVYTKSMPEELFGLKTDSYYIKSSTIQRNEFLSNILERYNIDAVTIANLVKTSKPIFNVRNITAGKTYTVFTSKENPNKAAYFIYQPTITEYIVYDLRDTVQVYKKKKEVNTKIENIGGTIENSLYEALKENGGDPDMAISLSKIFGGVINFYSIKEGDWFKIQYERQYVENEAIGVGKIRSAVFSHNGKEFQAHYFQTDNSSEGEYYDENGNSLHRSFLKAPLKFSRISSRYTKRRLHPVQKVWKAHLGTDYAAPKGTPIIATGDGIVSDASFTSGNGNYVKIQHNKTYSTQYLHMTKRAVKKGQRVKQGQVIGFVGSTGLATGPHVCYRFWKNGVQVDPLKQNFKIAMPIPNKYRTAFNNDIDRVRMEFATVTTQNGLKEVQYAAAYEERPAILFKYFAIEDSESTI